MTDESLVVVYESQGMFAAELVKAKLEAHGIPAMLKYESVGRVIGIMVDGLGRVEVQVPADFAEDALDLLDEDAADVAEADEQP
jgi:hypothetical protein